MTGGRAHEEVPSIGRNEFFQSCHDALRSAEAGAIEPRSMITDTVPLAALPAAFEALRRPTYQCKTLVEPWAAL